MSPVARRFTRAGILAMAILVLSMVMSFALPLDATQRPIQDIHQRVFQRWPALIDASFYRQFF